MKLTEALKIDIAKKNIILVGIPTKTNKESSEGDTYYLCQLKDPIMVGCSVDDLIEPAEFEEVHIRESALEADGWEYVDPKKPEAGFFMPKWVVDFSKGQEIAIYQDKTIAKWRNDKRKADNVADSLQISSRLKNMIAARKAGKK